MSLTSGHSLHEFVLEQYLQTVLLLRLTLVWQLLVLQSLQGSWGTALVPVVLCNSFRPVPLLKTATVDVMFLDLVPNPHLIHDSPDNPPAFFQREAEFDGNAMCDLSVLLPW